MSAGKAGVRPAGRRSVRRFRRAAPASLAPLGLATALAVLFADQWTKWWVLRRLDLPQRVDVRLAPHLDFTMVWNYGVTFGLLDSGRVSDGVLGLLALAITALLVGWMHRTGSVVVAVALGLIVGGALGNIADRLRYGAVVDFVRVHAGGWSWYVFNGADAAIVGGVAVLLLDGVRGGAKG